jgi:hypothetical protein
MEAVGANVWLLYEPGQVETCVGNLTEKVPCQCLNFPPIIGIPEILKIRCSTFLTVTQWSSSVVDDDALTFRQYMGHDDVASDLRLWSSPVSKDSAECVDCAVVLEQLVEPLRVKYACVGVCVRCAALLVAQLVRSAWLRPGRQEVQPLAL